MLASQEPGTEKQLKEVAKLVNAAGTKPVIRVQDAATRADLRATADLAVKELGGLHILVNALDTPAYGPAEADDDTAFDKVMENNLKTVWMACQEGGRVMLREGGGVIVNITSVLAERGVAQCGAVLRGEGCGPEPDARARARMGAQGYPRQHDRSWMARR